MVAENLNWIPIAHHQNLKIRMGAIPRSHAHATGAWGRLTSCEWIVNFNSIERVLKGSVQAIQNCLDAVLNDFGKFQRMLRASPTRFISERIRKCFAKPGVVSLSFSQQQPIWITSIALDLQPMFFHTDIPHCGGAFLKSKHLARAFD